MKRKQVSSKNYSKKALCGVLLYSRGLAAFVIASFIVLLSDTANSAAIPSRMSYQGYVETDSGVGLDGPHTTIIRIGSGDGTIFWEERQVVVYDSGYCSFIIGSGTVTIPQEVVNQKLPNVFSSNPGARISLSLVTGEDPVETEAEVGPSLQVLSVPYAFRADKADSASMADRAREVVAEDDVRVISHDHVKGQTNIAGEVRASIFRSTGQFIGPGTIPRGGIIMWHGDKVPDGWALCDGQNGTPNLSDRFILAASTMLEVRNTGGQNTFKLAKNQLPHHEHKYDDQSDWDERPTNSALPEDSIEFDEENIRLFDDEEEEREGDGGVGRYILEKKTKGVVGRSFFQQEINNRPKYYTLAFIMRKYSH